MKMIIVRPGAQSLLFTCVAAAAMASGAARAQDAGSPVTISANAGVFSDYRFRGVSLSDEDFALQGGIDVGLPGGFYVGTWGSSIDSLTASNGDTGEAEIDVYAGWGGTSGLITYDVGVLGYLYPGVGDEFSYVELYGSVGGQLGPAAVTLGTAYVPEQANTGDQDNIYVYLDGSAGIPNTPLGLVTHVGFEDGAFGDNKLDWLLGVTYTYQALTFGLSYVDTDVAGDNTDATAVFSVSASF